MRRDFFFFFLRNPTQLDGVLDDYDSTQDTKRNEIELDWSWIEIVLLRRRIYIYVLSLFIFDFRKNFDSNKCKLII